MKDIPSAEEEILEMIDEKKKSVIEEKNSVLEKDVKNKKYEEVPDDIDEFFESIKDAI